MGRSRGSQSLIYRTGRLPIQLFAECRNRQVPSQAIIFFAHNEIVAIAFKVEVGTVGSLAILPNVVAIMRHIIERYFLSLIAGEVLGTVNPCMPISGIFYIAIPSILRNRF